MEKKLWQRLSKAVISVAKLFLAHQRHGLKESSDKAIFLLILQSANSLIGLNSFLVIVMALCIKGYQLNHSSTRMLSCTSEEPQSPVLTSIGSIPNTI